MSPTQRSLKLLRDQGWEAEVVERFNSFTKQRSDLFGFADIIAMRPGCQPLLVQTTSGNNVAARRAKIMESDKAAIAVRSGFVIVIHGWRQLLVKRGGKAKRWVPRVETVDPKEFPPCPSPVSATTISGPAQPATCGPMTTRP